MNAVLLEGLGVSDRVIERYRKKLETMGHTFTAWKVMIHAAIGEAARQGPLPYFEKAFVQIEIVTPRGSNNARLWDTSNRAINVIINNLKGIFFEDDNMEHMAFSVVEKWGKSGVMTIRISELDEAEIN